MTITVELPWPPKELQPNTRTHWAKKARSAKSVREDAAWWAKAAGVRPLKKVESLNVAVTFLPPDRRRRDIDNMLASIKPAIDGIADAIGVDDSCWDITIRKGEPRELGAVLFEISGVPR